MIPSKTIYQELEIVTAGLQNLGNAVTIFGSGASTPDSLSYQRTEQLAYNLSSQGISIITGGGGGIMEAANKGAQRGQGASVGLCLRLDNYEAKNNFVDLDKVFYFVSCMHRKAVAFDYANAIVCFPGGTGTVDEVTEAILAIRTQQILPKPIILINQTFWQGLIDWFDNTIISQNLALPEHFQNIHIVDTVDEAQIIIESHLQSTLAK